MDPEEGYPDPFWAVYDATQSEEPYWYGASISEDRTRIVEWMDPDAGVIVCPWYTEEDARELGVTLEMIREGERRLRAEFEQRYAAWRQKMIPLEAEAAQRQAERRAEARVANREKKARQAFIRAARKRAEAQWEADHATMLSEFARC
jgi:hypothetical protein